MCESNPSLSLTLSLSLDGLCRGWWGGVAVMDTLVGGKVDGGEAYICFLDFGFRVLGLDLGTERLVRIEKN